MKNYLFFIVVLVLPTHPAGAAEPKIDFNRDIRTILSNNCYACHGPDEKERKVDLRLDTAEGAIGKPGTGSIIPGKPAESELMKRIVSSDSNELMPPPKTGKKLTPREQELIRAWIAQGAPYAKHWSYVPPVRPAVPAAATAPKGFIQNPIDNFILNRLTQQGMKPLPEAEKTSLIRRVALDLTGLPPTIAELDAYLKDTSANAYEKMVDRYLAKPAFGEHWARMWLDLAHTPIARATPMTRAAPSGPSAITSSKASTQTSHSTHSRRNRSPETCCRTRLSNRKLPRRSIATP